MNKKPNYYLLSAIALDGQPPSEIRLTPAGTFRARDGRPKGLPGWKMDALAANAIIAKVAKQADALVIDYDHQTLYTQLNGQPAPAAGWFKNLEWREGDGLYATNVEWTAAATEKITAKEYRYISPVMASDDKTGAVTHIAMAALVNYPALDGLTDLAALHVDFLTPHDESPMNPELLKLLGLAADADEAAVLAAVTALKAKHDDTQQQLTALAANKPDPAQFVPLSAFTELQGQFAALSTKQNKTDIEGLIAANPTKLPTPGIQEWARGLSVDALSAYLEKAPEVPALAGMQTGGKSPEGTQTNALSATTEELEAAKALGLDVADIVKNRG